MGLKTLAPNQQRIAGATGGSAKELRAATPAGRKACTQQRAQEAIKT